MSLQQEQHEQPQPQQQQEEVKTTTTTTTPSTSSGRYFCRKCNWSGAKINHAGVCLSCQMNGVKVVLRWQCNTCPKSILWNGKSNHERSASHISTVANPTQKVGPMRKKSASRSKTSSHSISELPSHTTPSSPSSSSSSPSSSPVDLSQVTFSQIPTTIHQPPPYQCSSLPQTTTTTTTSLLDELFMEDFLNTFELDPQPFILETNINLASSSETTPTLTSPGSPVSVQNGPSVFNTSEFMTADLSLEQSTLEILNTEIANLESRLKTLQYHRQQLLRLRNATQPVVVVVGSEPVPVVVATSTNTITPTANQTTTSVPSVEFKLSVSNNNTIEPSCYNEYDYSNRYTTPLPFEFATPSTPSFEFNSPPISDIIELIEFKSPSTPIEFATPRLDFAENTITPSIEFGSSLPSAYIDDELSYRSFEFNNSDSRDYAESNHLNLSCDPLESMESPWMEARGLYDGKGEGESRDESKGTRSLAIGCRELCGVSNNSPLECKPKDNSNNSLPLLTSLDSDSRCGIRQYKNAFDDFGEKSAIYRNNNSNHRNNNYIYINNNNINININSLSLHTIEFERTSLLTAVAA